MVKIDERNAFNICRRGETLHQVKEDVPELLPLMHVTYSIRRFPSGVTSSQLPPGAGRKMLLLRGVFLAHLPSGALHAVGALRVLP